MTRKPLGIAYVIDSVTCDTGGTQKQLLETLRRLDRTRFAPRLVCLWESPWLRESALPCPLHVLGHTGFLKRGFPGVVDALAGIIDEHGVDLVQTFFDEAIFVAWLGVRRSRRRPALLTSRRDMGLGAGNQPWYHRLFPLLLPLVNRRSTVVANAEAVRRYVARRERTPADRIRVIRNGLDTPADATAERPAVRSAPAASAAPGGPDGQRAPVGIVVAASLTPVKRLDVLLDAAARLGEDGTLPPWRLHLLGEGPERPALEAAVARLGLGDRVLMSGAVGDVAARLRAMDVGVLCSDREGLSNAILEYMSAGLPVVATDVGGNPELVDERNGRLCPAGDAPALAAALAELVRDAGLRRRLGEAGLQRVRGEFSWERALARYAELYEELAATAP